MNRQLSFAFLVSLVFATSTTAAERIVVGSKSSTEPVILGELLTHLGRSAGEKVEHRSELGGTQILWKSLLEESGGIHAYVDYTGTIREELLQPEIKQGQSIRNDEDLHQALGKKGIRMSGRLGFNNTYALGLPEERAKELNVVSISDLAHHPGLKFGFSDEFMERGDGWPQLKQRYKLPQTKVRTMDHNLAYRGLERGAIDLTDLYSTDAEINHYNLRVLEDDKGYFPTYHAVVLYRAELEQEAPAFVAALKKLEGKITTPQMVEMNNRVRLDRIRESAVAAAFLSDALGIEVPVQADSRGDWWRRLFKRLGQTTAEHLFLVVVSLSAAILVAVPLGVIAARNPVLGQVLLSVVSVIQTLPSMALLVFMIPFLGLGPTPAIAALFLYSLLPIVRNTYTGLTQIPVNLKESAEVLGLSSSARLWLVDLPLATPSILSGIKTAAVINVGTATIGALIGAGGYGAPILTGIRLFHIGLILQGAIPAALLAVAVQFAFAGLERLIVPKGLQVQAGS